MSNKTEEALARSEQAKQLRDAWAAIAKVAELVKTHPFIAVNAANECLEEALARTGEDLTEHVDRLRAAIERAGGVKAVFGEGL